MKSRLSLPCLLISQAQVVFNDNAAKFMLVGLALAVLPKEKADVAVSVLPALLVLPFVLFSPIAGWISDRFSKSKVLNYALIFQFIAVVWIALSIHAHQIHFAIFGFFLLAIQACIFSPAKQGILKELVGSEKLGVAVGWMEMTTIVSILLGTVGGGKAFDYWAKLSGDPWLGGSKAILILGAMSFVSWLIFQGVQKTDPQSSEPFRINLLWHHFSQLGNLWREKSLRLAALGVAYFYSFGGILFLTFLQYGRELNKGQVGAASETSYLLAVLGGGIAAGSLVAAALCRKRIELGLVPIGGLGMPVALAVIGFSSPHTPTFYAGLVILGLFGALFTVPLTAFLQDRAEEKNRGQVIAGTNLMTNIGGILAVGIQAFLSYSLHFSASTQCFFLILPSLAVALYVIYLLPESLLRLFIFFIAKCLYRVRSTGAENIPQGGVLLICNHVSYIDALILQVACPRPIRFIAFEAFFKNFWTAWFLKIFKVIPISPRHAKDAIRATAQRLKEGELVCVFPEGELTRTGTLQAIRKGFELMARQAEVPVVPVYLDSLWGSVFSFSEGRYFWKFPRRWPYPAYVDFGKPIPHNQINAAIARRALLDEGEKTFQQRPELSGNLGAHCFHSLARKPLTEFIIDTFPKRRALSRGMVLALATTLSRKLKTTIQSKRVGIVLPPGIGGTIANLAVVLMGKVPVNLNFTAGRAALESCLRRAEIDTIISATALKSKFPDFPWPEKTLDIVTELKACGKASIFGWLIAICCIPAHWLTQWLGIPDTGDQEEAGLLFTSGSSGDPKGVVLTHRNILGNVAQISAMGLIQEEDVLMACLPLFHSFGFTVTLWYPILQSGNRVVTVPSPLEVKKIIDSVREEGCTVMLGTPTFMRPYLRKAEAADFKTLRLVVTGAEKLPPDLYQAFQEKFGVKIMEGYGLTETSPVSNVNLPDPPITTATAGPQAGNRAGSVGRLIPGMTARIVDPETGQEKSMLEVGMLHLKGPNIFKGYLHDEEKTNQVLKDGWFVTGDLGRFDEDGFLFIEGRLSRFSKIGGEMVPHGTVEQKIIDLFGLDGAETQPLVVTGIPDQSKGESLVLLTTVDITTDALREKLGSAGLPNLWIPKIIKRVEKIPTLASGKLDLKGCEKLAREG